ncbi:MAG: J domain-containing protein [Gammaproteobacteria bacterium]|nr:J domain-containing protein [Gammaproteobacteria bacterium]
MNTVNFMQDYYEILNVTKTASVDEITRSYKKLALQCHPDIIPRNLRRENLQVTEETINKAVLAGVERFKTLSHAYSILTDPEKRILYDSDASVQEENYSGFDLEAFFKNFPIGAHIDKQSFKNMLTKINQKLDQTLSKSSTDCAIEKLR